MRMDNPSTSKDKSIKKKCAVTYCFVPKCPSNSSKFPGKLFLAVPQVPKLREKWMKVAKRQHLPSPKSVLRCCEDHFDMEKDVVNWMRFKHVGGNLILKKNVVPHIFECQQRMKASKPRSVVLKCKRLDILKSVENEQDDPPDQSDTGDDLSMYQTEPTKTPTDSAEQDADKDADQRHEGFSCNNCSNNIIGYRYTCVQCLNYDLCASCEARGAHCLHYVLRIPKPAPDTEVQSMLTAIRSHLLNVAAPGPEVEVQIEEVPIEMIKVEIKEEAPDPLESDQDAADDNYAAYSQEIKKEFTATEETLQVPQIPYNTATTTGIIDNTLVIIENPVLSEPKSKRRRANSPPPLVPRPVSALVAPAPAHLAPASPRLSSTYAHLAPASARLAPTSAHLAPTSARLAPDLAPSRMLENIILYPQREEPAVVEDKDESSSFVFSRVKKKPSILRAKPSKSSKLQAKPGQRCGTAPASTSRSDDKK